jgi:catecholate siderophore receptor
MRYLISAASALLLASGAAVAQTAPSTPIEDITVYGHSRALPKSDQPVLDTPQTITIVPPEELHEQAVTSLHQALLDVPGASAHANEDSNLGDNFFIRGFSALNDIYVDGMRDPGHYLRDAFDMQSLEVLEGPSGVLFGRGSTGGAINYITKAPQLDPLVAGTFMLGTDDTKRLTADIDQPIGPDAAFRVNLMGHDAGYTGRDDIEYSRFGIAPSFAFGIGTATRLTISLMHQSEYDNPDYGVPWIYVPGEARPFYTSNFYGWKNNDYARANADMATVNGEYDVNDWLTLRDRFRYGSYERSMQVTEPSVDDLVTGPLSKVFVDPTVRGVRSRETTIQDQVDGVAHFDLGPVSEHVIAGYEVARDTTSPTTFKYSNVLPEGSPGLPLLDPNPSRPFIGTRSLKSDVNSSALDNAIYAISRTTWENWELSLSARFDWFDATYNETVSATNLHHLDQLPSYRGALSYHPMEDSTLYFAYGTSFDPSAEALSLSTATAALAPQKTRAVEAGAKYAPWKGLLLNAAVFRTLQFNLRETNPLDDTTDILIGGARAEGFDLGVSGEIADHWKMWGGYEYLLATVTSSPNGDLGNRLQDTPRHSVRLWTSYEFMDNKLEIGAGFDYLGTRTPSSLVEQFNTMQYVPSYWTIGMMAGYQVTDNLRLQVNIDNLNGARYFDGVDDNHVEPGEGRTAFFTARFKM